MRFEIEKDLVKVYAGTKGWVVLVDLEDWNRLGLERYCVALKKGYPAVKKEDKWVPLHQLVLGVLPGYLIDHLNHNKLDARRSNLRHCRMQDSNINRGKPSHNKSGTMGVCWSPVYGKWISQLKFNGKQNRKLFENFEDAVAYRKALEKQFWTPFVHRAP